MSGPGASINMVDASTKLAIAQAAPPASDPVNRPSHYTAGSIEVIELIEQVTKDYPPEIAYHVGNVIKYLARAPHKGNLRQDLEKGENYLRRAINRMVYVERAAKQAAE